MLIHLDGSAAADALSGGASAERSHACIENLLLAHFDGSHVVSLLPADATTLRAAAWAPRARRALEHIDELYAQIAGLREELSWSLELGIGPGFDGSAHATAGGKKVIRAPLHGFDKLYTVTCTALLGENMADAGLFRELGLMKRAVRHWEGVEMNHERRGTGGSTFAPEFVQLADQGRILLAIADADKRHPGSGVGDTYRRLQAVAQERHAYQRARPLPTRTAEALVPLAVYREVFTFPHDRGDQRMGVVARLEQFLRSTPFDVVMYAHFKDGITLHQIEYPKSEAEGIYWRGIAEKANRDRCIRSIAEQCTRREECRCYVVDRLGDKALVDVLDWMKVKKSKKELASQFALSQNPELSSLADEVLAWGIALSPIFT
jgi:hypothetical protein